MCKLVQLSGQVIENKATSQPVPQSVDTVNEIQYCVGALMFDEHEEVCQ